MNSDEILPRSYRVYTNTDAEKFMTWHEVSILKTGEATFEYVNCDPKTGVIRWVQLNREEL